MRIIAGTAGGREIKVVDQARPYLAKTRAAIFNSLVARIVGSRVLDLYAGSGANGIEALSRGAATAVFVENSRSAVATIKENLTRCGLSVRGEVAARRVQDFLRSVSSATEKFDLIFIDPPFTDHEIAADNYAGLLSAAADLLNVGGASVFRREIKRAANSLPAPEKLRIIRDKIYGRSQVIFYERTTGD